MQTLNLGTEDNPLEGPILIRRLDRTPDDRYYEYWIHTSAGGATGIPHVGSLSVLGERGEDLEASRAVWVSLVNRPAFRFTLGHDYLTYRGKVTFKAYKSRDKQGEYLTYTGYIAPASAQKIEEFLAGPKHEALDVVPIEEVRERFGNPEYGWSRPEAQEPEKLAEAELPDGRKLVVEIRSS